MNVLDKRKINRLLNKINNGNFTSCDWYVFRSLIEKYKDKVKVGDAIASLVLAINSIYDVHTKHDLITSISDIFYYKGMLYVCVVGDTNSWKNVKYSNIFNDFKYNIVIINDNWTGKAIWNQQTVLNSVVL